MDYLLHLLVLIFIYGMLVLTLTIASGFTRLISLAHVAFFGVGAYVAAIAATKLGMSFWFNLPAGVLVAGVLAVPLGLIARRVVDDYFVVCSLSVGVILLSVVKSWMSVTRGPLGIAGIPTPSILGLSVDSRVEWVAMAGTFYLATFWIAARLKASPLGRVLTAISEDEVLCQSLGKDVQTAKLQSIVLGSSLAAIPGVLYAHYVSFIEPTSFSLHEAVFVLTIMVVGGIGNLLGSLGATSLLVLLPEALRFAALPGGVAPNLRLVLYGGILVWVIWRQGDGRGLGMRAPRRYRNRRVA